MTLRDHQKQFDSIFAFRSVLRRYILCMIPPLLSRYFFLKNEFIVGYGLDYDEQYRQLKDVYELTEIEE